MRLPLAVLVAVLLSTAASQVPEGQYDSLVLVTGAGVTVTLEDATVSYRPEGVMPPPWAPEFSLARAIEANEVAEITVEAPDGPRYRVLLRDGRILTVDGGEVGFAGTVGGGNDLGLSGFLSGHLAGADEGPSEFTTLTFGDAP